ncbi:MAG: hypothetical protein JWM11_1649, partial [Planctomycetaceae bacterium]|nr:hypothetical protein [Planctomycetaceae bacterium]
MPRFIPPHLVGPVALLIVLLWFLLVHHFRRSSSMQKFVAEIIGDETPESTLLTFQAAKSRLTRYLKIDDLDPDQRLRIEHALEAS